MNKYHLQKVGLVRPVVFAAFGLFILIVSLGLAKKNANLNRQAVTEYIPPLEVKIANVYETGFSVSWATKEAVNGFVVYGQSQDEVIKSDYRSPRVADRRGEGNYYTHLVTIGNLEIGKTYFFKIIDANFSYLQTLENEWREVGIAGLITLPGNPGRNHGSYSLEPNAASNCQGVPDQTIISCFRPNPIWGQVRQPDNQPAKDALVFIDIPGQSNLIATTTDENGKWVMDLSNLWKNDLTDYLGYTPEIDLIRVSALARDAMTSVYRQISGVTTGQVQKTSPVDLVLQNAPFVVRENTPTPAPINTATPTATPVPTNQPENQMATINPNKAELTINFNQINAGKITGKIELKNKAGYRQTRTVSFSRQADNYHKTTFDFSAPGDYEIVFKPTGCLSASLGQYMLHSGLNRLNATSAVWKAGDVNNDDKINILDISLLLSKYLTVQKTPTGADLNADGMINVIDLSLLLGNYYEN